MSDGVCLGCVQWVWKVTWGLGHALMAMGGLPVAIRDVRGGGGGGGRGGGGGGDHAGV